MHRSHHLKTKYGTENGNGRLIDSDALFRRFHLSPRMKAPRHWQPLGARVQVPTSAKLHRLCHVLGEELITAFQNSRT